MVIPKVCALCALGAMIALLVCCGSSQNSRGLQGPSRTVSGGNAPRAELVVEVPFDTSARDNTEEPILKVEVWGDEDNGVPVPYLYGYPLYAGGDASRGILQLRHDNWTGVEQEEFEDETGIMRRREHFPQLGCTIEGIQQDAHTFIPLSLICGLPAPDELGGFERPVVGKLLAGARDEDILKEPSLLKAFFGDWHLKSTDYDTGNGEGFFNTDYGLLAFGFDGGRLASIGYYFHLPEKRWRSAALWVEP